MRRLPRSARARGFTLIELTVALVASLAVVLGLMALSKEASRTFNEEVRSTASEASLRTANDRLRADLARAGFMSTGNIQTDPRVCMPLGTTFSNLNPQPPAGIKSLQSILLVDGGSAAQAPLSANQSPTLSPDAILIAGNFTTAEQLPVLSVAAAPSGACTRITMSPVSPALYRIAPTTMTAANQATELLNAFVPVAGKQFIVRLVDETGGTQYLETCNETSPVGFVGNPAQPYVDIDPATKIYAPVDTKTKCGVGGMSDGHTYVNPVQVVRWELMQASGAESTNAAQYTNALGHTSSAYATIDTTKYDLVRSYVDASGTVLYASTEVVAEYAVDLDFAFTVELGTAAAPSPFTYEFENANNVLYAKDVSTASATSKPQRLREVRYRLVTRTAQGDRSVNVAVSPVNYTAQEYLYRYCINPTSCAKSTPDGTLCWARARTVTGEVSLPNLQSSFF